MHLPPLLSAVRRMHAPVLALALAGCAALPGSLGAAPRQGITPAALTYPDVADLVVAAPVIVDVLVTRATEVEAARAPGLAGDKARIYVEAQVQALLRGAGGMPGNIRFLVDLPRDSRGRAPKLKKMRFLAFANARSGQAADLRLIAPDAILLWTPDTDTVVRRATQEALRIDAAPAIDRIQSAFHVAGTVIGEGETQIFLRTKTDQPISISVLTRPGQPRRWGVSLGEIVDEAAAPPAPDTLLWYRLACALPAALPPERIESPEPEALRAAQADYRYVRESLGACERTRTPPPN